jgi:flagellar hook assembly protein FlgD
VLLRKLVQKQTQRKLCNYTSMIRHKITGPNNYIHIKVGGKVQYLGTTRTNQNSIHEEIKKRLSSGSACYHAVQNLQFSHLLSKNVKIKTYKTSVLSVAL